MLSRAKLAVVAIGLGVVGLDLSWEERARGQGGDKEKPPVAQGMPKDALRRLGSVQLRHGSRILCLSYSPDGRILAAGGGDDPVRLWDTDTGLELRVCPEPWVSAMVWSPRGS